MNISIRLLNIDDAATSCQWRNNPKIWEFTGSRPDREITVEMEREWIKNVTARDNERRFAIEVDGRYVGNTYLTEIDGTQAELHYFIGEHSMWGKGITTSAVRLVVEYAKEEIDLKRVFAVVKSQNMGSRKMLEKNGFSVVSNGEDNNLVFEILL